MYWLIFGFRRFSRIRFNLVRFLIGILFLLGGLSIVILSNMNEDYDRYTLIGYIWVAIGMIYVSLMTYRYFVPPSQQEPIVTSQQQQQQHHYVPPSQQGQQQQQQQSFQPSAPPSDFLQS